LSGGHVDPPAVAADGEAVDAGVVRPLPEHLAALEVVGEQRAVAVFPAVASVADVEPVLLEAYPDAADSVELWQADVLDEPVSAVDVVDVEAAVGEDVLVVPYQRRSPRRDSRRLACRGRRRHRYRAGGRPATAVRGRGPADRDRERRSRDDDPRPPRTPRRPQGSNLEN